MQQVRLSSPIFRQHSILLKSTRFHLCTIRPPHAWAYNKPHGPNKKATHTQSATSKKYLIEAAATVCHAYFISFDSQ